MTNNVTELPRLARIEHHFNAALVALNYYDQKDQLRRDLLAIMAFSGRPVCANITKLGFTMALSHAS